MNRGIKRMITVDIRGNYVSSGKTFMGKVLWHGLKQLGFDPNNKLVSVDCQDRDLDITNFDEQYMREIVRQLNEKETHLHLIDLNLPMSGANTRMVGQIYQIRSRTHNGQWTYWKPCTLDTYMKHLAEPMENNTYYEVRSITRHPDGPTVEIPERTLVAIAEFCERLDEATANLSYEQSYAGEKTGSIKRNSRALHHMLRSLMNLTYSDTNHIDRDDVKKLMDDAIVESTKPE